MQGTNRENNLRVCRPARIKSFKSGHIGLRKDIKIATLGLKNSYTGSIPNVCQ